MEQRVKKENLKFQELLKHNYLYNLNIKIGTKALLIIKKYHTKHTISVADALIAATAIENKIRLYTDNLNDYTFIQNCSCLSRNKNKMYKCATQRCTIEKQKLTTKKI